METTTKPRGFADRHPILHCAAMVAALALFMAAAILA